ncbi:MAG: hypothetical protein JW904_02885 [Spirochaetales bacterium]|nr:hypothetical protein [Spirochaetales bacterium]
MTAESLYTISAEYSNDTINTLLSSMRDEASAYTQHFTHSEDYFLRLPQPFSVPRFLIHHSNDKKNPDRQYIKALESVLQQLKEIVPHLFAGLSWYFDAIDIFHPGFYRSFEYQGHPYLYLFRFDLGFKPHYHTMTIRGDNDLTHGYESEYLFCEGLYIPLQERRPGTFSENQYVIKNLISETWIGETGRGYRVKGIWMDDDLSKFFSRLFLLPEKRLSPYFPFVCKYRTICEQDLISHPQYHQTKVKLLHEAIRLIEPEIPVIQHTLRKASFTEDMAIFQAMKKKVDSALYARLDNVIVKSYLNSQGLREYIISSAK